MVQEFNALNSWIRGAPERNPSNRIIIDSLNVDLNDMSGLVERSVLPELWVQQPTNRLNHNMILIPIGTSRDSLRKCHQELAKSAVSFFARTCH